LTLFPPPASLHPSLRRGGAGRVTGSRLFLPMKLSALLSVLPEKKVFGNGDPEITGLVYDPLRATPGCLYVAINIYTQLDKIEIPDGHPVLPDAIRAGAVAVVLQQDLPVPEGVVKILVPDSRYALALLAVEFYGHPARSLQLVGVTGTNGKTTTTHVIESLLMTRYRTGLIGTLYYKINGRPCDSKDTTPEPPDLAAIFTQMVKEKCEFCTMEVSSHAVDFHRVVGVDYQAAVWTNLSQDHLDWHKTMENYRNAKLRWLASLDPQRHVALNNDDPSAHYFIEGIRAHKVLYGIKNKADVTARDCRFSADGTRFTLVTRSCVASSISTICWRASRRSSTSPSRWTTSSRAWKRISRWRGASNRSRSGKRSPSLLITRTHREEWRRCCAPPAP
jgi:UDP-N-acetylmuramoyl-L-alanyl-D-glutamate--2,6-diaminopimelate ligase